MTRTLDIDVHHVTRVEGHGSLKLKATDGSIEQLQWRVDEAPRFFEAMVRGCSFEDIQTVASRICGICSVTHSVAALKAIENAMGIEITGQTDKLRILTHYGEQIESQVLHIGFLAAPDLLGVKSVVPLIESDPDLVKTIMRCHGLGNEWMERIGGRKTHPVTMRVGGFCRLPTEPELVELKEHIEARREDFTTLVDAMTPLASKLPDFQRETEYVGLVNPGEYTFYHGSVGTTDAASTTPPAEFDAAIEEYVSDQSTAKWARWNRDSYAVGALARFNLNYDLLCQPARDAAEKLGLEAPCHNPYMNTIAQLVECVQVCEHGMEMIDELIEAGIRPEQRRINPSEGAGVGIVEAPRGTLFHRYAFDERGFCTSANMVIPTNQNHANIQKDLEALAPRIIDRDEDEIRLLLEMLVRSYDPCISCSTHFLDVEFV